jgi:hypothetical protein
MNSASRGLRPGRAPTEGAAFASAEADAWRAGCRMNSACGGLRPMVGLCRPGGCLLRWRRPTPGAERLRRPISIGVEAFGRRSACADREGVFCVGGGRRLARSASEGRFQSAWRPSAGDREVSFASAEADAWRPTVRPMVGLRRPGGCLLRWRRPTPGAQRLRRPISIGVGAFGRMVRRPGGGPAPTPEPRISRGGADGRLSDRKDRRWRRLTPGAERL